MSDSILTSTKKALSIEENYTVFDDQIIMFINGVFTTLNQLGIGPDAGFAIEDAVATWFDFLGDDPRLNSVKPYVYLRVRMLFDPPQTSYLMDAFKQQIAEAEWRLNVKRESESWVDPLPATTTNTEVIIVPSSQAWYSEPA